MCSLQLAGERYPLEGVRTLERKRGRQVEEEEHYSLQTEPPWKHKALSEPIQFFVLGAGLSYGKLPKRGRINRRRDSSKRIELGEVRFSF